jgi:short-subunit dehydrogenase
MAEQTAELALERGAKQTKVVLCDVTKLADVEALAATCDGPVDLVVNNAGVATGGLIGELPIEDWRWTIEVDLFGVIYGCHVFVPILKKQGRGHILNVASAAGLLSAPGMAAYNVAKAGVISLSETLGAELRGTGVGVTALCPMFFKTNIVEGGRFCDENLRTVGARLVNEGKMTAEDVARAAIAAVEKDQLYSVPMADGRWAWRLKRVMPGTLPTLAAMAAEYIGRSASAEKP